MSLKQRKGAPAAASSSSSDAPVGVTATVSSQVVAEASGVIRSQSSYDYLPGKGSAREIAAAQATKAQLASGGLLAGFSGGSEFVFQAAILLAICVLAFMVRLFSVVRYESVIHEFDPSVTQRTTQK
jgi:hypothetical protein